MGLIGQGDPEVALGEEHVGSEVERTWVSLENRRPQNVSCGEEGWAANMKTPEAPARQIRSCRDHIRHRWRPLREEAAVEAGPSVACLSTFVCWVGIEPGLAVVPGAPCSVAVGVLAE